MRRHFRPGHPQIGHFIGQSYADPLGVQRYHITSCMCCAQLCVSGPGSKSASRMFSGKSALRPVRDLSIDGDTQLGYRGKPSIQFLIVNKEKVVDVGSRAGIARCRIPDICLILVDIQIENRHRS